MICQLVHNLLTENLSHWKPAFFLSTWANNVQTTKQNGESCKRQAAVRIHYSDTESSFANKLTEFIKGNRILKELYEETVIQIMFSWYYPFVYAAGATRQNSKFNTGCAIASVLLLLNKKILPFPTTRRFVHLQVTVVGVRWAMCYFFFYLAGVMLERNDSERVSLSFYCCWKRMGYVCLLIILYTKH